MNLFDRLVVATLPLVPKAIVGRVADRYIAGETPDEALRLAAGLNAAGFVTTLDLLGEDVTESRQARDAAAAYGSLLDAVAGRNIDAYVSVKPTQFGLKLDPALCLELFRELAEHARRVDNFVRVEMEDSSCTAQTVELFRKLRHEFVNVGVVLQSYLRRSMDDVAAIVDLKPNVRLVKGVYVEPRKIAFSDDRIINRNFVRMAKTLLEGGAYVAFATHDEVLVWEAIRLVEELGLPPDRYEFQMLLGVEEELRDIVRRGGHRVRVYIPFGEDWYAYSVRRLRENPKIARYVLRAMVGGS